MDVDAWWAVLEGAAPLEVYAVACSPVVDLRREGREAKVEPHVGVCSWNFKGHFAVWELERFLHSVRFLLSRRRG